MEDEYNGCKTEVAEQAIRDDGTDHIFRGLRGGRNLSKNRGLARPFRFKPLCR